MGQGLRKRPLRDLPAAQVRHIARNTCSSLYQTCSSCLSTEDPKPAACHPQPASHTCRIYHCAPQRSGHVNCMLAPSVHFGRHSHTFVCRDVLQHLRCSRMRTSSLRIFLWQCSGLVVGPAKKFLGQGPLRKFLGLTALFFMRGVSVTSKSCCAGAGDILPN